MKISQFLSVSFCSLLLGNSFILSALALPLVNAQPKFKIYQLAQAQSKLRVAVLDFDYSAVSDPRWVLLLSGGTGGSRGVSDILVNKLVQTGSYNVIERSRLDAVLKEQNLGASGRVDPSSAAQIGKILGVDAVIIGSITQFDLQQRNTGFALFGVGVGGKDTDAYVRLNIRMIDTRTAEIIAVAEGKGNTSQSDSAVVVQGIGGAAANTSNEGKLLTLATQQAVDNVIEGLSKIGEQIAAAPRAISTVNSVVAATSSGQVILNKGSADGYQVGMKLSIERVTQTVKDPTTGKVLRLLTQKIGLAEIVEVDDASSVARIVGGGGFKIGDVAKPTR